MKSPYSRGSKDKIGCFVYVLGGHSVILRCCYRMTAIRKEILFPLFTSLAGGDFELVYFLNMMSPVAVGEVANTI